MGEFKRRGIRPVAILVDTIFSSDGIFADPASCLAPALETGLGHTDDAFWGYARHKITPDVVTIGKPMGDGFPMTGMTAKPADLHKFCADTVYFSTFGGNSVAAAAGLAVLDVILEEGLQHNALHTFTK